MQRVVPLTPPGTTRASDGPADQRKRPGPGLADISFGIVDGQAVLIDVVSDAYFTLDQARDFRLRALRDQGEAIESDALVREAVGLATPGSRIVEAQEVHALASLADQRLPSARLADAVRVATLVRSTRLQLQRGPFGTVLEQILNAARCDPASPSSEQAADAARRFLAARRLVPIRRNCLLDSLSLLRWLSPVGENVTLVFGAKLHPFGAHCWVQLDSLILNDRLDHAALFTPVRTVPCSAITL